MRFLFTLILHLLFLVSYAQNAREKELKTDIKEVTVFLNSAQIFESGSSSLSEGKTLLRIKNVTPYLDEKSIQVKGEGTFTILSVNHKLNHLQEVKKDSKIDSLAQAEKKVMLEISRYKARLSVLTNKEALLNANRSLSGQNTGVSVVQIKQALDLYEAELSKIREEELRLNGLIEVNNTARAKIDNQLKELHALKPSPTSEIEIIVSTENPGPAKFKVTYLVSNAGWYPKYDVRLENIKSPLELTYKAEVHQNTGTDWKNVKLRFSNGDPNQTGVAPRLDPWRLGYARYTNFESPLAGRVSGVAIAGSVSGRVTDDNGAPVPGVNVIIKGTTIGTTTDVDGRYTLTMPNGSSTLVFSFIGYTSQEVAVTRERMDVSMSPDIRQLEEVVVAGYGAQRPVRIRGISSSPKPERSTPIPTTVVENQTTVEFEVETPYSIKSNGESIVVDLKKFPIDAFYQYYAVPKLEKDAFLVARVSNWDQYHLLEGEANLYFEDAYVGRTILNARSLQDTLDISLGRDKNIIVGRERSEQFCKRKSLGSNVTESRGFKIVIRNKKSQPIRLVVFDQMPVSVIGDISVSAVNISDGEMDDKDGIIRWDLTLESQQQKELLLHYDVKYPKRENVILE